MTLDIVGVAYAALVRDGIAAEAERVIRATAEALVMTPAVAPAFLPVFLLAGLAFDAWLSSRHHGQGGNYGGKPGASPVATVALARPAPHAAGRLRPRVVHLP